MVGETGPGVMPGLVELHGCAGYGGHFRAIQGFRYMGDGGVLH